MSVATRTPPGILPESPPADRPVASPAEWSGIGAMTFTILGLNLLGWGMLAAALGGHHHVSRTAVFGSGPGCSPTRSACATPSTPTTSPPSTTRRAS